jgi:hypothetical protein
MVHSQPSEIELARYRGFSIFALMVMGIITEVRCRPYYTYLSLPTKEQRELVIETNDPNLNQEQAIKLGVEAISEIYAQSAV